MKTFLAATAAVALLASFAVAACTSDDSEPAAATVIANVGDGGACTSTSQCAEGLQCGFPIAKACAATGVCVPVGSGSCTVQAWCPCNGDPPFSECNDGKFASEPVSGHSCTSADGGTSGDASVPPGDGAIGASDGGVDAHVDAPVDSAADGGLEAAVNAGPDAGDDASDAAHD